MREFYEYLEVLSLISPLFFFVIAVTFRLLDNSGYLFLKQEIIIQSSYVSLKNLKEQAGKTTDRNFKRKLEQVLVYRKLHRFFLILMCLSLPISLWLILNL